MLFMSKDAKRFITTSEEGAPCFTRPSHSAIAKTKGVRLEDLDNVTAEYYYTNKNKKGGVSINNFLNIITVNQ